MYVPCVFARRHLKSEIILLFKSNNIGFKNITGILMMVYYYKNRGLFSFQRQENQLNYISYC